MGKGVSSIIGVNPEVVAANCKTILRKGGAMLGRSIVKTLHSAGTPEVRAVMVKAALWSVAALIGVFVMVVTLLGMVQFFQIGWLEMVTDVGLGFGTLVLVFLVFPMVVPVVATWFQEGLVPKLVTRYYPQWDKPVQQPALYYLRRDIMFVLLALGVNLCAVPFYFIPVVGIFLSIAINGYLLSRELFHIIAGMYLPVGEIEPLRLRNRRSIWSAGAVIAALMLIPGVNMLIPALAVALMLHVFAAVKNADGSIA